MQRTALCSCVVLLALGALGSLWGASPVGAQNDPPAADIVELDRRPGEGERCIVCLQNIHGDEVVELRYKGRSFFVASKMLSEFGNDPDAYFDELQARAALFDERSIDGSRLSKGWLAFGVYVLVGLIAAALCGYLAVSRGLAPLPWFFAGLVGNVAAVVVLLVTPRGDASDVPDGLAKVPTTHRPMPCPRCGASNHPAAAACSACGFDLSPAVEAETQRALPNLG